MILADLWILCTCYFFSNPIPLIGSPIYELLQSQVAAAPAISRKCWPRDQNCPSDDRFFDQDSSSGVEQAARKPPLFLENTVVSCSLGAESGRTGGQTIGE